MRPELDSTARSAATPIAYAERSPNESIANGDIFLAEGGQFALIDFSNGPGATAVGRFRPIAFRHFQAAWAALVAGGAEAMMEALHRCLEQAGQGAGPTRMYASGAVGVAGGPGIWHVAEVGDTTLHTVTRDGVARVFITTEPPATGGHIRGGLGSRNPEWRTATVRLPADGALLALTDGAYPALQNAGDFQDASPLESLQRIEASLWARPVSDDATLVAFSSPSPAT